MSQLVSNRKQEYYNNIALNLNNPKTSAKTYWSILKIFYNGKKIPVIPPLLINNKLVSNFKTKANHLNAFFALHCTPFDNNSKIPISIMTLRKKYTKQCRELKLLEN